MIMSQNMPRDSTRINYDDFEMSSHSSHSSRSYSAEVDAFLPLSGSQLLDAGANSASPLNLTFPIAKSFSHFSNSFLSNSFKLPTFLSKPSAIVVVDPWSTGNRLCHEIANREITLIVLWNHNQIRSTNLPSKEVILHNKADYNATVSQLTFLSKSLYDIKAIIPGSETGVLLAEQLSNTLTYPTNDLNLTQARRNKYLMGETLRSKGVRAVKQTITTDFNEALAFIKTELIPLMEDNKLRVILKPNMGAGSDDVFLCKTFEEIEKNFNIINGKINSLGLKNDGVLVQEYLDGKEYVIDSVTKNGKHKIVAIWEYDKREVNGRFNIYFGNFPLVKKPTCEITPKLEKYIMEVLNALEFKNGPSHAEIKMTAKSGPCLVEIGARCHGGGGTWVDVAKAVWGFDQISHLIDSIHFSQSSETFDAFHNQGFPTEFKKFGCVLDFIGYQTGQIVDIPGEQKVKSLKSFFKLELFKKVGDELELTVDCNTSPGQLILIHDSEEQVRKDYQTVHDLLVQNNGFFAIKQNN